MAGATIRMTAEKQKTLQEIHEKIHYIRGAEQISKTAQEINGVVIWTLAYEKFYMRSSSYASVTVVLTEAGSRQTACVVAGGGGTGMINYSYGGNRDFARSAVRALEECGFTVTESDLDGDKRSTFGKLFE